MLPKLLSDNQFLVILKAIVKLSASESERVPLLILKYWNTLGTGSSDTGFLDSDCTSKLTLLNFDVALFKVIFVIPMSA